MIGSAYSVTVGFRYKGRERFFDTGDQRRLPANQIARIARILARLDVASEARQMDLPGFRLHPFEGDLAGNRAVSVCGNWRITFRFEAGNVTDLDLLDYH